MIGKGRQQIFTSEESVTEENVLSIIQKAIKVYQQNARDCQFLLDFDSGVQPLMDRAPKKVMDWIDCQYVDNVAKEANDFWIGFGWGNPITLVQRGDSADDDGDIAKGIAELNNCYAAAGNVRDLQKMANFIVKCGHCYTLSEINKEWEEGESYFTRDVLDPRFAFVVRSSRYSDQRPILGASLSYDEDKNMYITAYSKDMRVDISATKKIKGSKKRLNTDDYNWEFAYVEKNPIGKIAITEWYWTVDRTAIIESEINALNNINALVSDIGNGVQQNIQAIWWANNVEFPKVEVEDEEGNKVMVDKKPRNGEWVATKSARDAGQPSIQPLTIDYHLDEMQRTYTEQRALILEKLHVPQRNDNSGGSTGVAMDSSTGYADAESIASAREGIVIGCQNDELKVVLAVLKASPDIKEDNPMLKLLARDIQPAIRRPKNYDLVSKSNAIATLLSHGFALEDCVSNIPLFQDATQVITRSGDGVKKYQDSVFSTDNEAQGGEGEEKPNSDRLQADLSDQVGNSPILSQ